MSADCAARPPILSVRQQAPDRAAIAEAARILRAGALAAFPTETVYGLGADATSAAAVARVYKVKGRPSFNPLIAHVSGLEAAFEQGVFSPEAEILARRFWPGALTLVLPLARGATVCALARAGLDTIALRVPSHPAALDLLKAAALPLAAPSANRSGRVSPVTAAHVADDLGGDVDIILDGGRCPLGVESTIIACLDGRPRLLRPGGLPREAIESALGSRLAAPAESADIRSPGSLASHYAPTAAMRLEARELGEAEAGLDFGATFPRGAMVRDLSPTRDLEEAAANLFSYLRELDALGPTCIAVAPVPAQGLGEAINDRLRRAAAPRKPEMPRPHMPR
ncbi:L-threonylcarbamoyladenylate synthase [Methylocapsa palsarum]|uniref:Threonylcarbamoyl-AMP synthase n=1 Tax=Methylocapsa palsarum TaxID=1612308 RepID=A0A1I3X646_9HYPH|nr:L-threonylcarbamoyladenylate synthase [Methylocapsa palsarum]SFK14346.1 L-threonylcarbamoyladenylate synthase [Methylocapsa palsarum]